MKLDLNNYNTIGSLNKYVKQLELSHGKLFFKSLITSGDHEIIVNSSSLVNKYYDYVSANTYTITLSDKEYLKYRYQPKLFCYEVYGTTELWAVLLKINNHTSVSEFNSKTIKVFGERIFNVLNEILITENEAILENLDSIGR